MKFECGKKRDEKYERWQDWHRWFAWYPVKVAQHDCRWLEFVERRREPGYEGGWDDRYRSMP